MHLKQLAKSKFIELFGISGKTTVEGNIAEINIAANGNCLYTSVFLGYLLPSLRESSKFAARLSTLVGSDKDSENLRRWLLKNIQDPSELRSISTPNTNCWVEAFKTHMGLKGKVWGGNEEIQVLATQLNVCLQEHVENSQSPAHTKSDRTLPDGYNESSMGPLETIHILRCNPNTEEAIDAKGDVFMQIAQSESVSTAQSLQHFRLIKNYSTLTKALIPSDSKEVDDPYSSDSEGTSSKVNLKKANSIPVIQKNQTVSAALMTIPSVHSKEKIPIKGNQIIFWARKIFDHVSDASIDINTRVKAVKAAVQSKKASIQTPLDWIRLEGIFDTFAKRPARVYDPFVGILTISLNSKTETSVDFRYKVSRKKVKENWVSETTTMLYAHLHDKKLIEFLVKKLGFAKFKYSDNHGLSYPDIVNILHDIQAKYKCTDAQLATRQLAVLKGTLEKPTDVDRFLAFFNAVLFGSEASRNNLSYVTGLMTLDLISKGKLSYEQAFKSPDYQDMQSDSDKEINFAVYPMTSPYTGANNFLGYLTLIEATYAEEMSGQIKSETGMKLEREFPQWAQIPLKEALLIHFWLCEDGLFEDPRASTNTILISCAVQRSIANLLVTHFGTLLLSPIPNSDYKDLTCMGIHPIAHRLSNSKPLTPERLGKLQQQSQSSSNELNMIYLTPSEKYALESSYYKNEKLYYDSQYEMAEAEDYQNETYGSDEEGPD